VQGGVATIEGRTDVTQHKGVCHAPGEDRRRPWG